MLFRVVTRAATVSLAVYSCVFVVRRVIMLLDEWRIEQDAYERAVTEVAACTRTDEIGALAHACQMSRMQMQRSPLLAALFTVLSHTHLCGDWSCTDLLIHVFGSAPGMLVLFLVGVITGLVVLYNMSAQWDRQGSGFIFQPPPPVYAPHTYALRANAHRFFSRPFRTDDYDDDGGAAEDDYARAVRRRPPPHLRKRVHEVTDAHDHTISF